MIQQDASYNVKLLPEDSMTFFKKFIQSQDEVPGRFNYKGEDAYIRVAQDNSVPRIIQKKDNDSCYTKTYLSDEIIIKPSGSEIVGLNKNENTWLPFVFLFCFVIIAIIRLYYGKKLSQLLKSVVEPKTMNVLLRESNIANDIIILPLLLLHFLTISLFVFRINEIYLDINLNLSEANTFIVIILVFVVLFALKILLVKFIGWLFATSEQSSYYNVNTIIFSAVSGIIMTPLTLLIYYVSTDIVMISLGVITFFYIGIEIFRLFKGFLIGIEIEKLSRLYLFLYLCTVEFLPVLIIVKLAINRM